MKSNQTPDVLPKLPRTFLSASDWYQKSRCGPAANLAIPSCRGVFPDLNTQQKNFFIQHSRKPGGIPMRAGRDSKNLHSTGNVFALLRATPRFWCNLSSHFGCHLPVPDMSSQGPTSSEPECTEARWMSCSRDVSYDHFRTRSLLLLGCLRNFLNCAASRLT